MKIPVNPFTHLIFSLAKVPLHLPKASHEVPAWPILTVKARVDSFDTHALWIEGLCSGGCGWKNLVVLQLFHMAVLVTVRMWGGGWDGTLYFAPFHSLVQICTAPASCCKYVRKGSAVLWIGSCLCYVNSYLLWGFLLISQKRVYTLSGC